MIPRADLPEYGQVLLIHLAVGFVAAGRDVKVVDGDAIVQLTCNMAGMAQIGKIHAADLGDGHPRQDGDAVVPLLPSRDHVGIAKRGKALHRDLVDRALALLQAQDIGRLFLQQLQHDRLAQADRVDVPGGKGKGHCASLS